MLTFFKILVNPVRNIASNGVKLRKQEQVVFETRSFSHCRAFWKKDRPHCGRSICPRIVVATGTAWSLLGLEVLEHLGIETVTADRLENSGAHAVRIHVGGRSTIFKIAAVVNGHASRNTD